MKTSLKKIQWLWNGVVEAQRISLLIQSWFQPAQKFIPGYAIDVGLAEPTFESPQSQLVTVNQFFEPAYRYWCKQIRSQLRFNRKTWEFNFILQVLDQAKMLAEGRTGLGFGCGEEPLPAVMVKRGVRVVASDQSFETAKKQGWADTAQHSSSVSKLNALGLVVHSDFVQKCSLREVDMNAIPEDLSKGQFDFCWSACAFEHLGSIEQGLQFVENSLKCLKPGGLAVHTTEFNLSSNDRTFEHPTCVVFRERDIKALVNRLESKGHQVYPVNFHPGSQSLDHYVDLPPYRGSPSLKLMLDEFVVTSIGLVIKKGIVN